MFRSMRLRQPTPGTVLGGLALIVATSGVAVAAIPGGDGTVTACISRDGTLKVIDEARTCHGSQTTVKLASADAQGKVRHAVSADSLGGFRASDFLRSGGAAGGDLAGSFPSPTIGDGTVTSSKVADESLTGDDIAESTLTGLKISGVELVREISPRDNTEFGKEATARCPGDKKLIGLAGFGASSGVAQVWQVFPTPTSVTASAIPTANPFDGQRAAWEVWVYGICAHAE